MGRSYRMKAILYLPMKDGETAEEAEDRMLELTEKVGIEIYAWEEAEEIRTIDLVKSDNFPGSNNKINSCDKCY